MAGEDDKKVDNPFEGFVEHPDSNAELSSDEKGESSSAPETEKVTEEGAEEEGSEEEGAEEEGSEEEGAEEEGSEEEEGAEEEGSEEEEAAKPKPKRSVQQRINEVIKGKREEERRANQAEQALAASAATVAELRNKLTAAGDDGSGAESEDGDDAGKPDPEKYKYGEFDPKYIEDFTDWRVDQRLASKAEEDAVTQQTEAEQREVAELQELYVERVDQGLTEYDDFEETVLIAGENGEYPLSQEVARLAIKSPVGHHVLYHVASDLELAQKIFAMSPLDQGREFGRLEAQYSPADAGDAKPKPNRVPKAGAPPTKRQGGSGVSKPDPATESFADFERREQADRKKRANN